VCVCEELFNVFAVLGAEGNVMGTGSRPWGSRWSLALFGL